MDNLGFVPPSGALEGKCIDSYPWSDLPPTDTLQHVDFRSLPAPMPAASPRRIRRTMCVPGNPVWGLTQRGKCSATSRPLRARAENPIPTLPWWHTGSAHPQQETCVPLRSLAAVYLGGELGGRGDRDLLMLLRHKPQANAFVHITQTKVHATKAQPGTSTV